MKRNDIIYNMRDQGKSLREIGDKYNITRERVRQILFKYTKIPLLSVRDILEKTNITTERFHIILDRLKISKRTRWHKDILEKVIKFQSERKCAWCGKPLSNNYKYCGKKKCTADRWRYVNWSDERKRKHHIIMKRWEKANPEAMKAINRRANKKYYYKHREKFKEATCIEQM